MQKPINVLIVSLYSNPSKGGAEQYLNQIMQELGAFGFNLFLLSSDMPSTPLSQGLNAASGKYSCRWHKQLRNYMTDNAIDIVYAHATVPALAETAVFAAKQISIPVVLMYHSDITGHSFLKKTLGLIYNRLLGQPVLSAVDHFMTTNKSFFNHSKLLVNSTHLVGKTTFAPPGVALIRHYEKHEDKHTKASYILFVGKPDNPNKGFEYLYRAFKVSREKHDLELWVLGGAVQHSDSRVKNLGHINSRDELSVIYSNALVTVLPSTISESFGMVLAESLVCGTPIIGTNVGGIPELIEEGKNGFVVKPKCSQALVKAIDDAVENNSALRAFIHVQNYHQKFSWHQTAEIVAKTLKRFAPVR